ncbi:hypothetical protein TNCV_3600241 [Trichonephila clavipes]|nr:hypothetical protein TNCV_3600241 [Trichonephila clavipes]
MGLIDEQNGCLLIHSALSMLSASCSVDTPVRRFGSRDMGHSISEVAMKFGFSRVYLEYREPGKTSNLRHRCDRKKIMQERDQ